MSSNNVNYFGPDPYFLELFYFHYVSHIFVCNIQGLNRESEVEDINGERMSAMTIFTMAIRYMREHLLEALNKQYPNIQQSDIMFVITVPAIWNDASKQFMREAAIAVSVCNYTGGSMQLIVTENVCFVFPINMEYSV